MAEDGSRMTERQRKFYKAKMRAIKEALRKGDKVEANRHAEELKAYFNVK